MASLLASIGSSLASNVVGSVVGDAMHDVGGSAVSDIMGMITGKPGDQGLSSIMDMLTGKSGGSTQDQNANDLKQINLKDIQPFSLQSPTISGYSPEAFSGLSASTSPFAKLLGR